MAPGHKNSMTIVVKSPGSKAQICQVSQLQAQGSDKTPSDICREIIKKIEKEAHKLINTPVAACLALDEVRDLAKKAKAELLGTT